VCRHVSDKLGCTAGEKRLRNTGLRYSPAKVASTSTPMSSASVRGWEGPLPPCV
jgi:hypothetical protein